MSSQARGTEIATEARFFRPALLFTGAPLDVVKLAAAVLMLGDHVNTVLLRSTVPLLWRFGRIAFPLFCFVLACHLIRGTDPRRYIQALLLLAIPTQPIFAAAFLNEFGSILITLAIGAALGTALLNRPAWIVHATFAFGTAAVFVWPLQVRTGVDFGVPGVLFAAALIATLAVSRLHGVWLAVLLFALNAWARRGPDETWLGGLALDGLFAGVGALVVIGCAVLLKDMPRFLPRYALHLFYPGHLLALAALRSFGVGG